MFAGGKWRQLRVERRVALRTSGAGEFDGERLCRRQSFAQHWNELVVAQSLKFEATIRLHPASHTSRAAYRVRRERSRIERRPANLRIA